MGLGIAACVLLLLQILFSATWSTDRALARPVVAAGRETRNFVAEIARAGEQNFPVLGRGARGFFRPWMVMALQLALDVSAIVLGTISCPGQLGNGSPESTYSISGVTLGAFALVASCVAATFV